MDIRATVPSRDLEMYRHLMAHVRQKTEAAGQGSGISVQETARLVPDVLEGYTGESRLLEACTGYYSAADLVVSHAVNVAIFALKMALDMQLSAEEVEDTLIAGLLHDIGFGRVPAFHLTPDTLMLMESGPEQLLTKANKELVRGHSEAGARAILPEDAQARRIAAIVWQHHERADGTGYPRGLTDGQQALPAQLLAITDVYEALIHPRPFRDALVPPMGIQAILQDHPGAFSARMLKQLLRSLPPFPVGYGVRLNDGSIARVIRSAAELPLRPDVAVVQDGSGGAIVPPREIRLRDSAILYITECLPRFPRA